MRWRSRERAGRSGRTIVQPSIFDAAFESEPVVRSRLLRFDARWTARFQHLLSFRQRRATRVVQVYEVNPPGPNWHEELEERERQKREDN
jgi:hypothetical protein